MLDLIQEAIDWKQRQEELAGVIAPVTGPRPEPTPGPEIPLAEEAFRWRLDKEDRDRKAKKAGIRTEVVAGLAEEMPENILTRSVYTGVQQAGTGFVSLGARLGLRPLFELFYDEGGFDADALNEHIQNLGEAARSRAGESVLPPWIAEHMPGAAQSLTTVGATLLTGPVGIIGTFAAQRGNEALTEAEQAGLKGFAKAGYAARAAAIEGGVTALFHIARMGGLESVGRKAVWTGVRNALKRVGIGMVHELTEEQTIGLLDAVNASVTGTNPEALTADSLKEQAFAITMQTLMVMGVAKGGQQALGAVAGREKQPAGGEQEQIVTAEALETSQEFTEEAAPVEPEVERVRQMGEELGRRPFKNEVKAALGLRSREDAGRLIRAALPERVKAEGLRVKEEAIGPSPGEGVSEARRGIEHGGARLPVEEQRMAGAMARFVAQPAETPDGKRLIQRLQRSVKRGAKKVGPRSIVEHLNNMVHAKLLVGKTQTTKRLPAKFMVEPHVIRSRSGNWQLNFHEAGHALSYYLADEKPDWYESISPGLSALTQMEGSMASSTSAEEGMAELVRRYVVDHGSLPSQLVSAFETLLGEVSPDILAGLRDTHRAYAFHRSRPILEQLEAIKGDKPPKGSAGEAAGNAFYQSLLTIVGGGPVLHRLRRHAFKGIAGPGKAQQKLAREFMAQIEDTPADFMSAYQSTIHIPQETQRALYGVGVGREGIRIRGTGEGFDNLSDKQREALTSAGFEVPKETMRHGNWIYLNDKSISKIKHDVGLENWDAFQLYGQYRAALERHRKKGHEYPGLADGLTPETLQPWLREQEQKYLDWDRHFKAINRYMDQLLLVPVVSGEISVKEAIRIKGAWEDYWPLPRQTEDRAGRRTGAGIEPTSGIRQAFGSELPFRSLDEALEVRTRMALDAYYTNRMMLAVRRFSEKMGDLKDVDFDVRKEALRLMIPMRLETKLAATLTENEEQKIIADYVNEQMAQAQGIEAAELPTADRIKPEDIEISTPGQSVWRLRKPNAVHVVAPFEKGERRYYQVTDPLLFDLFARGKSPQKYLGWVSRFIGGAVQPWKRALTQNILFALRNFATRDPSMAGFMGEDWKALVPYYYAGVGLLNRVKGTNLNAVSESELWSRSLDHTNRDAHRSVVESFFDMLKEGIAVPGYTEMTTADKIAEAPGQAMSTLMKPIDMVNWITGGRWISLMGEKLPREGAYLTALRKGFSEERAQTGYDYITGNFGQRSGNANVASLVRTAGFLNPSIQIMYGQAQRLTDPDPKVKAFYLGAKIPGLMVWGGIGAAFNYLLLRALYPDDDEREDVLERMRERPDEDRLGYISFAGRIRLPFDYGLVGSAVSYGWNSIEEELLNDPVNARAKAIKLLNRARDLPGITDIIQPHIKTGVELYLNHSFFFDDEIVPSWMEAAYPYNPELQVWPDTADVYNKIGKGLKVSPIKVRYAVRGIFTRMLDDTLRYLDRKARGRPIGPEEYPVVGGLFQREPRGWGSKSVQALTDLDREYDTLKSRLDVLLKEAPGPEQADERREIRDQLHDLTSAHNAMKSIEWLWKNVKTERKKVKPDYERIKEMERDMRRKARAFLKRSADLGR